MGALGAFSWAVHLPGEEGGYWLNPVYLQLSFWPTQSILSLRHFVFFYLLNRVLISFRCLGYFTFTPRLADMQEGQFQPFCITRKHPHLLSTSLPAHLHRDLLGWSPGAAVTNDHLLLLETLSPLGCCLHPLSMSAAACHRMWLLW